MNPIQKVALRLAPLVLVGSLLGFGPSAISVTEKLHTAQSAFAEENYREQAEYLVSVAESYPWWKSLWEEAGDAAFKGEDYPLALHCYQLAQQKRVLSAEGLIKLGESYLANGQPASAEELWQGMAQSPPALEKLARFYEGEGDFPGAAAAWEDYLALEEGAVPVELVYHYALLMAAVSPPQAVVYLDQAAADYPRAGDIAAVIRDSLTEEPAYQYAVAGQALAAADHWLLAEYAFARAAALRPDYQQAYLYWGEALQHLDSPTQDPLQILEQGLALDEGSAQANLFLGLYYQRSGDHNQAITYFQKAEQSWPDHPEVYLEQGRSLAALGQLDEALSMYQQAIQLDPLKALYYRQLAEFCVDYSYQIREMGLPAARLAVQLEDKDPANLDVMGRVLLGLSDAMNADRFFQLALEADPAYAPAYYHLGILYSARDDRERARYYLEQTLLYTDNPATRDQAERLLSTYQP
jgi:tetratricopeptide (TPR) repeat protein